MIPPPNLREQLSAIGIGSFNATALIPYLLIAPATTDPKAIQVVLLVQHIQKALYGLGATDVPLSGRLDVPTARALAQVTGPDWERTSWSGNIAAILRARASKMRLQPAGGLADDTIGMPVAVGGPLDFLPDVPGGLVTYGVVGFLIYRHFKKGARS